MARPATVYKVRLQVSDLDRHYYAEHSLTLAQHPSETEERLLVRLLAFALNADEALNFGKGLSSEEEPALSRLDLSGNLEQWIDVGLPDEKRLRKAAGRARQVLVYAYGGRAAEVWWEQNANALRVLKNLVVYRLPTEATSELAGWMARGMALQLTLQDGVAWLSCDERNYSLTPLLWQGVASA